MRGEPLVLLPQRAAYLPRWRTLLVADAHVGKAHTFRRLGVPVPRGTTGQTLATLDEALAASGATRVVFLGDLLHARPVQDTPTLQALAAWRERHAALEMTLVRGNHDRGAGDPRPELRIDVVDEPLALGPLALCHEPRAVAGAYVLAGHVHPGVGVGRGLGRLRLPCFWFGAEVGVLPAFGAFTGSHTVTPAAGDRVFVLADGAVVEVPPAAVQGAL